MTDLGVSVPALVHHLAACPDDFLAPPAIGSRGTVAVAAVVGDAVRSHGAELPAEWAAGLAPAEAEPATENWLRSCLVSCWLAAEPGLEGVVSGDALLRFLGTDLHAMSALVRADQLVTDPDRREELARLMLRAIGVVPAGETPAQADDRLATLDSATRSRVVAEARAAEERAREVRAALERQRAAEAAARASRE